MQKCIFRRKKTFGNVNSDFNLLIAETYHNFFNVALAEAQAIHNYCINAFIQCLAEVGYKLKLNTG